MSSSPLQAVRAGGRVELGIARPSLLLRTEDSVMLYGGISVPYRGHRLYLTSQTISEEAAILLLPSWIFASYNLWLVLLPAPIAPFLGCTGGEFGKL